jgi:hypothetical protein
MIILFPQTAENNKTTLDIYVNFPIMFSDFKEIWNFSTDIRIKLSNIKFDENSSSGSSGDTCGQTKGQT